MRIVTQQDMEQIKANRTSNAQPCMMPYGMYVDIVEFPDGCVFPDGCRFEYVQVSPKRWTRFGDYCKFGDATLFSVPVRFGWSVQLGKDCVSTADMQFEKYAVIGEHFRVESAEEREKPVSVELGAYSRLGGQFVIRGNIDLGVGCTIGEQGTFYYNTDIGRDNQIGGLCRFKGRTVFAQPTYFGGSCRFGDTEEVEAIGAISMDIPSPEGKKTIMTVYCQADKTLTEFCMSGGRLDKRSVEKAVQIAKIIFDAG
ncbi:MAG: hypothetical protein KHY77_10020 [Butyricicoccus pullicaecorum]|nr:hypothetical protein [Butyricicoccus pullicaecorum]